MSRATRLATALAVAVAIVIAAGVLFVTGRGGASATGTAPPVVAAPASPPHVGSAPASFSGTALDGTPVDLSALRGNVVAVNFFATWCGNCRAELPLLQQVYLADRAHGLTTIGVDYRDTGDAAAFTRQYGVTFPILLDPQSVVGTAYGVQDLPVTVFVRRDGTVAAVFHGQLTPETLTAALAPLL